MTEVEQKDGASSYEEKLRASFASETRINELVRKILIVFGVFTLVVTILRLIGLGQVTFGFIEASTSMFEGGGLFRLHAPLILRSILHGRIPNPQILKFIEPPLSIGGWLYTLLPVALFIYAKRSRINERSRPLLMVFAIFEVLNHIAFFAMGGFLLFFMRPNSLRYALIPIVLCVGMIAIFRWCRELGRLRKERGEAMASERSYAFAVVLIVITLALSSSFSKTFGELRAEAEKKTAQDKFNASARIITSDDYTLLSCNTRIMRASPDGKLLAIGGETELSVWDVATREMLFSDPSISVYSLRFSPSGKYLAVVGTGVPNDKSSIALYEVEGFKRLPQIALFTANPRDSRTIRDVAFRPGESSLIYVYYDRWIDELLTPEERKAKSKEWGRLTDAYTDFEWAPLCEERVIATGKITARKILPELRESSINSLHLSPDGSFLAYVHTFNNKSVRPEHRNFTFYETRTWAEKTFLQSRDVSVGTHFGWDSEILNRSGDTNEKVRDEQAAGKVYFKYEQYEIIAGTTIKASDNLGEIDIPNMTSRDLFCRKRDINAHLPSFSSIGFSPDGQRIALLSGDTMRIIGIEGDGEPLLLTWRSKAQLETPGVETWGYESWLTWVDKNTVAVAVNSRRVAQYKSEEPKFFFQTVPSKEEAK